METLAHWRVCTELCVCVGVRTWYLTEHPRHTARHYLVMTAITADMKQPRALLSQRRQRLIVIRVEPWFSLESGP